MFVAVQSVAISYSDKKNKKRNFFGRKLRTAKSKERSKSENALDIDQSECDSVCQYVNCRYTGGDNVVISVLIK